MPPSTDGLLVVDKPPGMTSRAALDRAQRWFPRGTRMGHTGTLDPLATGVLVLCIGSATRLAEYVQNMRKTYRTTIRLGAHSDTDDADGRIISVDDAEPPDRATVSATVVEFVGERDQVPPSFSAAKVSGRRAYDLARMGTDVVLSARRVRVYGITVLRYAYPELELEVECGKGTYIRSLARDLGERLGCGGYVQALCRMRVGPFGVEEGITLEMDPALARSRMLPVDAALTELPRVVLSAGDAHCLAQGREVTTSAAVAGAVPVEVAVFDESSRLLAVGCYDPARHRLRPEKVLALPAQSESEA